MNAPQNRGVVTVGSINIDLVVRAQRRPQAGETFTGEAFAVYVGGKGANQAVQAALGGVNRAGKSEVPSYMVARMGADVFAPLVRDLFDRTGVNCTFVREDPAGTGIGHVVVDAQGDYSTIIVAGANGNLSPADIADAEPAFAASSVLLLQLETPMATVVAAAAQARRLGLYVCLNAAPALATPPELLALVDLLVVNEIEAQMLLGATRPLALDADIAEAAQQLSAGRRDVIITLGERGAYARDREGAVTTVAAHRVNVVNTIGAGDAFVGEAAAQLAAGRSLHAALPYANAAAALAVMRSEPQAREPQRAAMETLMRQATTPA
jgi:ribokinase